MTRSRPMHHSVSIRFLLARLVPLALVLLVAGGCGGSPPTATDTGPRPQLDIAEARTLLLAFRERGIELRFQETVEDPILPALTDWYRRNANDLLLYGFSTEEDAEEALATISADGRTVDEDALPWSGPVHFHHTGRLIVLHVGSDSELRFTLNEIMGSQVAGD